MPTFALHPPHLDWPNTTKGRPWNNFHLVSNRMAYRFFIHSNYFGPLGSEELVQSDLDHLQLDKSHKSLITSQWPSSSSVKLLLVQIICDSMIVVVKNPHSTLTISIMDFANFDINESYVQSLSTVQICGFDHSLRIFYQELICTLCVTSYSKSWVKLHGHPLVAPINLEKSLGFETSLHVGPVIIDSGFIHVRFGMAQPF